MFIGAIVANWLLCRPELSPGAKLAYARLAQYAGKDGACFPKQKTLAAELGVTERTANEYIRQLVKFRLIEKDRPGLGLSNRYYFLDHPWIYAGQSENPTVSAQERQETSATDQKNSSGQEQQNTSVPSIEENQLNGESIKKTQTHGCYTFGIPLNETEAVAAARHLGIEVAFASQEFHAKKSVGWKDGYGNPITSWPDHLLARWPVEQRKRAERHTTNRTSAKRPVPPRKFDAANYNQPV